MTIWILSYSDDNSFAAAFSTEEEAKRYIKNDSEEYSLMSYELVMDATQHQQEIIDEVLGYCLYCDTPLTRQNVYYGDDNKPIACYKCASGRYY